MTDQQELEQLSSQELHDRAMRRALRHLDVKFLWRLVQMTPAAEMAAGETREARRDAEHWSSQIAEAINADEDGKLADALRPVYIEYLTKHAD